MILPIVAYGAPVLRQATVTINDVTPQLRQLITDMWQTLDNTGGVGLAAPQIGQSLRLFLVDSREETDHLRRVFINPTILEYGSSTCTEEEGCLSIPGMSAPVTRPERIVVRYQDEALQTVTKSFQGQQARIIQHEYDHVMGRLYLDLLSPLARTLLRHKLQALSRGKVRPGYPMQIPLRN